MTANRWIYWLKHLLIGIVVLLPVVVIYFLLFLVIYFWGYPPFLGCYTEVTPAYVEEINIGLFTLIGLAWLFLFKNGSKGRHWLQVVRYGSMLFVVLVLGLSTYMLVLREPFYEDFSATRWRRTDGQFSAAMARKLVYDEALLGKSKEEINKMLGERKYQDFYELDWGMLALKISYQTDKVYSAKIICLD